MNGLNNISNVDQPVTIFAEKKPVGTTQTTSALNSAPVQRDWWKMRKENVQNLTVVSCTCSHINKLYSKKQMQICFKTKMVQK